MTAFRRILAAVDFSDWTPDVLATAAGLARASGAKLELLHVLPLRETDTRAAEAQLAAALAGDLARAVADTGLDGRIAAHAVALRK